MEHMWKSHQSSLPHGYSFSSLMRTTWPTHLILFNFITLILFDVEYNWHYHNHP